MLHAPGTKEPDRSPMAWPDEEAITSTRWSPPPPCPASWRPVLLTRVPRLRAPPRAGRLIPATPRPNDWVQLGGLFVWVVREYTKLHYQIIDLLLIYSFFVLQVFVHLSN